MNTDNKIAPAACKHPGYLIVDGVLKCSECRQPSPSQKWRGNVYGVNSKEAKAQTMRETGAA